MKNFLKTLGVLWGQVGHYTQLSNMGFSIPTNTPTTINSLFGGEVLKYGLFAALCEFSTYPRGL